jgi:glycosyltransferase involved in cell wall biosynthesis
MKTTLSVTILNEESTIDWLLEALSKQFVLPDEIILVDGGSTDRTVKKIKQWQTNSDIGRSLRLFVKKGNRSVGRNLAVSKAKYDWLAFTDAGCIPSEDWLQVLLRTQRETKAEVIAGYYQGLAQSRFEEAVIPYVLVMPNRVNKNNFLPATRSMLIRTSTFRQLGGFDTHLDHNEDFAFAHKLKQAKVPMAFAADAVVGWLPRTNLRSFWQMIYRFALGDIQAKIVRPKVLLIFLRYFIFLGLLGWIIAINELPQTGSFFPMLIFLYLLWAIWKNKRYVPHGWLWLPVLQIVSDLAVMVGSLSGTYSLIRRTKSST